MGGLSLSLKIILTTDVFKETAKSDVIKIYLNRKDERRNGKELDNRRISMTSHMTLSTVPYLKSYIVSSLLNIK